MFENGERVEYRYDPAIPLSWPHLHGVYGTVVTDADDEEFIYVLFDFKPHLGALPCEASELVKLREQINAVL